MKKKIISIFLIFVILFTDYSFVLGEGNTTDNSESDNGSLNIELYDFDTPVYSDILLNAVWTPITYNITYDLDGGYLPTEDKNPTTYTIETTTFTLNNPVKAGYIFAGWTGSNGTIAETTVTIEQGSTGDKVFKANWIARTDTAYLVVHYKENSDGIYILADTESKTGTTATIAIAEPKTYAGFTVNPNHPDWLDRGEINDNGTLVLRLFYKRVGYTVTFDSKGGSNVFSQIVKYKNKATEPNDPTREGYAFVAWKKRGESDRYDFDTEVTEDIILDAYWYANENNINYILNGGRNNSQNPKKYSIEDTITLKDPTRSGYIFGGWYEDEAFTQAITEISNRTGDITVYAKWVPDTDTPYTVEHYKKDRSGQYQLEETELLYGTTGEAATAQKKTYSAFVENTSYAQRVPEGIIEPDGSLILKLYYDPITYTIDYELNGGKNSIRNPSTYTIYDEINFEFPTKIGYAFDGWYEDEAFTKQISTLSNRTENITLYAKWSPRGDTPYAVEHYKENKNGEYILFETENKKGTTEENVTAVPMAYTGFEENTSYPESVKSGTVAADGSLVLKLFYKRVKYRVSFDPKNGTTIEDQIVAYENKSTEPQNLTKLGYSFEGWKERGKTELFDFDTEITQDTYLVADWKPINYRINYVLYDGKNDSENPQTYTIEDTVYFMDPSKTGYDFGGWFEDAEFTNRVTTISNRCENITVYAKWIAGENVAYTVQHFKKLNGSYQLVDTENSKGTTGTMALATAKSYTGYRENTSYSERRNAGIITPDGSLVLKLFYDPIEYTIEYAVYGGENDSGNPTTYTVNDTINLLGATKQGYIFEGWYEEATYVNKVETIANRTGNITLHARWAVNTDINSAGLLRRGYSLTGWKVKGTNELYDLQTPLVAGMEIEPVWEPIVYNIDYKLNDGTNDATNPSTFTIEDGITLKPPTRAGYTFLGWYEDEALTVPIDTISKQSENKTVYAKWAANDDIQYKVEYYKKNKNGTYEIVEFERRTGKTDELVEATSKTFEGYIENTDYKEAVNKGTIKADGSLVLKFYYDPIEEENNNGANPINILDQSQKPNYADGKIPQTGIFNIVKIFTIAIASVLVAISGIKYFKIKKKQKGE